MKKLLTFLLVLALLMTSAVAVVSADEGETAETLEERLLLDRERGLVYFERNDDVTEEELCTALTSVGIPVDFENEYLYRSIEGKRYDVMVPEERILTILTDLNRLEIIKTADVDPFSYPAVLEPVPGDVDRDEVIGLSDYMLVRLMILGKVEPDTDERTAADVNYNGKIDLADYMLIRYALLNSAEIPECPAVKDMNEEQLAYWLEKQESYVKTDTAKRIVFLNEGVTAEQAMAAFGDCDLLYSSEIHYPNDALWIVVEIEKAQYQQVLKNIALSDLQLDWSFWH